MRDVGPYLVDHPGAADHVKLTGTATGRQSRGSVASATVHLAAAATGRKTASAPSSASTRLAGVAKSANTSYRSIVLADGP